MTPKVSIQMCTYNRAHFIKQAIKSILAQNFSDWELIILDDSSTDNTKEIITPFLSDARIRYIRNELNLGITKNRNKILSVSRGEYIAVLDSDDFWINSSKLEKQVEFLEQNTKYALVGTNMQIVDEEGHPTNKIYYAENDKNIRSRILIKNQFCHSSVLYRKNNFTYDESLSIWEDYDLWLRIGLENKFANLPIFGVAYRRHSTQSDSQKRKESLKSLDGIIKKYKNNYPNYFLAYFVQIIRKFRG